MLYLKDPKTKEPSLTLTLMWVSFYMLIAGSIAFIFGQIETTGPLLEIYVTNATLYFSRRFTFQTKNLTVNNPGENNDQSNS